MYYYLSKKLCALYQSFSFYLLLLETTPQLSSIKCSHRMELKEPISFSQKYDIDLRLFLKK